MSLAGLEVGDRKVVELPSSEAYGERDESQVTEVPLDRLPPDPEVGAVLQARTPEGQMISFTLVELGETTARLDPNHPLAGMDLTFDVTIVSVESATAEELTHGHVH
jgi:FKBP-type peptidyl-prolyl cis-trans isomerase SlyD